jgi:hypothetical protein
LVLSEESVASESGYSSEEGRLLAPNRYSRIRIVTEFLEGGTLKEFLATPEVVIVFFLCFIIFEYNPLGQKYWQIAKFHGANL